MNNVMLDLETMGNTSNAAIIAIGAVRFDKAVTDRFYKVVNLQSCVEVGLDIEPSTVMWWMQQSAEARGKFAVEAIGLNEALRSFADWVGDDAVVWGNGAAFDNVILANAYRKSRLPLPWKFYNDRCYRTVKNLHPEIELERVGTYHCAVDDAESQAQHLIRILNVYPNL